MNLHPRRLWASTPALRTEWEGRWKELFISDLINSEDPGQGGLMID